jgi:hypothetical protein
MPYLTDQKITQVVAIYTANHEKGVSLDPTVLNAIAAAVVTIIEQMAQCFAATPVPTPTPSKGDGKPVPHHGRTGLLPAVTPLQAIRGRLVVGRSFRQLAPASATLANIGNATQAITAVAAQSTWEDYTQCASEVASLGNVGGEL